MRRDRPRLLNAWAEVRSAQVRRETTGDAAPEPDRGAEWVSRLCLELTARPISIEIGVPARARAVKGDFVVHIRLNDTSLIMAEDDILIADGLIRRVSIREVSGESDLTVSLEHPVAPIRDDVPGMPYTVRLTFSRSPLRRIFCGKRVGVDPGHGGADEGLRGPVDLLEKDTSLAVALELATMLEAAGSIPVLTRNSDVCLSGEQRRSQLRREDAELCVEIHAAGSDDPMEQRYGLFYGGDEGLMLARTLAGAFQERMGIPLLPASFEGSEKGFSCPAVRVEPLCITHFSDEANFRAPLYRRRMAQAIFNGIHRYLVERSRDRAEEAALCIP